MQVLKEDIYKALKAINDIPDKSKWKTTTSKIFKLGILQYLTDTSKMSWIELGAAQGHTTHVLAHVANSILSVEIQEENCDKIRKLGHQNVEAVSLDLYSDHFHNFMSSSKFDAAIIDAVHKYQNVISDIENCKLAGVKIFVFDDYGGFEEVRSAVNSFILDLKSKNINHRVNFIGAPPGTYFPNTSFKHLKHWEGVIVELL